ncbi:50S ribosomal protein L7/L12 [bacterium]|nr:50S ribosomal protein L7/L12 [bacterium]MBU1153653.1 50S ribosomal protein L7/L12 [bacterium]MBU1782191.1 50S ribosomal protein L7/L12 [bacterium]
MPVATKEELIESISKMSVLELSELVKELENKFGVTAAMMPAATGPTIQVSAAPAVEEKTEFDVILASVGDKKIQVIKEIRVVTSLGLKEAKDVADSAPKPIKEKVSKKEAEEIKARLEAVGAVIEIK